MLLQNINSILKEKGRTSVFVAHRLRTIFDSDKIIVLRGGQVAESGTHSQLIDTGGVYSELWSGKPKDPLFIQSAGIAPTNRICVAQETSPVDETVADRTKEDVDVDVEAKRM